MTSYTRGDTFHILSGHVNVANTSNAVTAPKTQTQQTYQYNAQATAVNKFTSQAIPKNIAQTFYVNSRSSANPLDISPVMMLR